MSEKIEVGDFVVGRFKPDDSELSGVVTEPNNMTWDDEYRLVGGYYLRKDLTRLVRKAGDFREGDRVTGRGLVTGYLVEGVVRSEDGPRLLVEVEDGDTLWALRLLVEVEDGYTLWVLRDTARLIEPRIEDIQEHEFRNEYPKKIWVLVNDDGELQTGKFYPSLFEAEEVANDIWNEEGGRYAEPRPLTLEANTGVWF